MTEEKTEEAGLMKGHRVGMIITSDLTDSTIGGIDVMRIDILAATIRISTAITTDTAQGTRQVKASSKLVGIGVVRGTKIMKGEAEKIEPASMIESSQEIGSVEAITTVTEEK